MASLLLIEDDDAQRFVASFALKKAGHEVREAADGPKGLLAAKARKPDLIVCDVMMPGMTGYEVLAMLRADPALVNVPVILLTAMSDRKHIRQGMSAGADDYLTKPYRPDELCESIDTLLARRQAQQAAFMTSVSGVVEEALEQQKETLGQQYESMLVREINARWDRANAAGDVHHDNAFLLLADLLGSDNAGASADTVRQVQQSARDTLYLFGADHVLPYGTLLLAVFAADTASMTTPVESRVLRAAVALGKAAAPGARPVVALHSGPVVLVAVHDALHGDQGHSVAPGASITSVAEVHKIASGADWRLASSAEVAKVLVGDGVPIGRRARTARGEFVVEVLAKG
jgi:CheY-like chemotaxis protein